MLTNGEMDGTICQVEADSATLNRIQTSWSSYLQIRNPEYVCKLLMVMTNDNLVTLIGYRKIMVGHFPLA